MKLSYQLGSAAVLDRLPECKIVKEALDHPGPDTFLPLRTGLAPNDIEIRFYQQTRAGRAMEATDDPFVLLSDRNDTPIFIVLDTDVPFVLAAAERIINERNILTRAKNIVTMRNRAAKNIISGLGSSQPVYKYLFS